MSHLSAPGDGRPRRGHGANSPEPPALLDAVLALVPRSAVELGPRRAASILGYDDAWREQTEPLPAWAELAHGTPAE
ncbi:hypothetical protein [Streptomyces sp. NRRL F-5630]|uniref:hypothetical protein n=1 Tax=Streptomyces sp. NRRL F-5630 TaxID=1463864 RepID=UPI003D74EE8C